MFSSITSYLFGATETEEPDVTNEPETKTDDQNKTTPTLETTQAEDEWILVEKSELRYGKRPRQHSPQEARKRVHHSDNECIDSPNIINPQCHFQEALLADVYGSSVDPYDTASDSDLSSVTYPMMEESWLVTPPACFTAGTSKMETSSMENLLIEHPSMSVYHHRGRQSSTGVDSENSESSNDEEPSAMTARCQHRQAGLARHEPPHRPRALAARVGLIGAKTVKSMQKSQQRTLNKNLSQNNIRRSNRTHQSAQGKVSRRYLVQQPRTRISTSSNKQY